MDAVHIHLILTHFPIVGTFIAVGILAYGLFVKNDTIKKVALIIFILMAITTIPVFLTGEEAEETVEHIAGVSEHIIEEHEELAEKAIWLIEFLGALSLFALFAIKNKKSSAKTIVLITFIVSIITFGVFAKVGNLGGQIRHSEIRANNSQTINDDGNEHKAEEHQEDDDDD